MFRTSMKEKVKRASTKVFSKMLSLFGSSNDSKSALDELCFRECWKNDHDSFYHALPPVLDG